MVPRRGGGERGTPQYCKSSFSLNTGNVDDGSDSSMRP